MRVVLALLFLALKLQDESTFSFSVLRCHQHRFRSLTRRRNELFFTSSSSSPPSSSPSFFHTTTTTTRLSHSSWQVNIDEDFINGDGIQEWCDPSTIVFEDAETAIQKLRQTGSTISKAAHENKQKASASNEKEDQGEDSSSTDTTIDTLDDNNNGAFPYALMMQVSAPYIAEHANNVAVFHIPGSLLQVDPLAANKLLSDIHMSWMLGMKIVMVLGSSHDWDVCDLDAANLSMEETKGTPGGRGSPYSLRQCYPARHPPQVTATSPPVVTNQETLRLLEEEAGFLRTEVERKINRYVQRTGQRQLGGNVVSGNFYTATRLRLRSQDDRNDDDSMVQYTGYASQIHVDKIQRILQDHNDVVLLTTVGQSRRGNVVNVNGHQLAAAVAASLQADKVIYLASEGCVLQQQLQKDSSSSSRMIQELPLSVAKSITNYHNVHVRRGKFATIQEDRDDEDDETEAALEPRAVELLLNLAWSSWAVENGVRRAHIVNPTDGALLEELFTSRNGANTCLYHDNELLMNDEDDDEDEDDDAEELVWGDDDAGIDDGNNVNSPFSSLSPSPTTSATDFLAALRARRTKSNSSDSFQ